MTGPARLDEVAERAAAIVGTRAATAYGEHVAAEQRDTVDVLVEMLVKLPSKGWLVSGVKTGLGTRITGRSHAHG